MNAVFGLEERDGFDGTSHRDGAGGYDAPEIQAEGVGIVKDWRGFAIDLRIGEEDA